MAAVPQAANITGKIKCPNCKDSAKETYTAEDLKTHDAQFHQLQEKNKSNSWKLPPPAVQSEVEKALAKKKAKKYKTNKRSVQATQARIARRDNIP